MLSKEFGYSFNYKRIKNNLNFLWFLAKSDLSLGSFAFETSRIMNKTVNKSKNNYV